MSPATARSLRSRDPRLRGCAHPDRTCASDRAENAVIKARAVRSARAPRALSRRAEQLHRVPCASRLPDVTEIPVKTRWTRAQYVAMGLAVSLVTVACTPAGWLERRRWGFERDGGRPSRPFDRDGHVLLLRRRRRKW